MRGGLYLVLLFILTSNMVFGQKIHVSMHQDTKFLFIGDDRGNGPGTVDFLLKVEFRILQFRSGYVTIYPNYEYADLVGGRLNRYTFGIGYIKERVFTKNLNVGVYPDYGAIQRNGFITGSFGINIELFYKITKRFSLSYMHQTVQRSDFIPLYNDAAHIHVSSFVGFKIHL